MNTFSWLGGLIPSFRRNGIAKALAKEQERIVQESGYEFLELKTRNHHKPMLLFALSNGFNIVDFKAREEIITKQISLRKRLKKN